MSAPQREVSLRTRTMSAAETCQLARQLGSLLQGGEVLALTGTLGSGKTTWVGGLARGAGCPPEVRVTSPTFVLEQVYPGRLTIHHFDAYRLHSAEELLALGFEERLGGDRVVVVEWADRVAGAIPPERLLVELTIPERRPEERLLRLSAREPAWGAVLRRLAAELPEGWRKRVKSSRPPRR